MLTAETAPRPDVATPGYCWGCGVPGPTDPCTQCGERPGPGPVPPDELIGAPASVRHRLRLRSGVIVAETPTSVFLAMGDASLEEIARPKLVDVGTAPTGMRSSAWTLVKASRSVTAKDRRSFDDLITSFVIRLIDRSVNHARAFVLDALEDDCPAWLTKVKLSKTERDFLFASYQADRGNSAAALERLLQLPPDRYPSKDAVLLRCFDAIRSDETLRDAVRVQLAPFAERPLAQALLAMLDEQDLTDETWIEASRYVLGATAAADVSFPREIAATFLDGVENGSELPAVVAAFTPEVRRFAFARAVRVGADVPDVSLADLTATPAALIDDAIDRGALTPAAIDREHPSAAYVLARLDPDALTRDELESIGHHAELARRAFLRGDRAALEASPKGHDRDRLLALLELKHGAYEPALERLDVFDDSTREKVECLIRCLEEASIHQATNEVLTDGTTWPLLAGLLPDEPSALSELGASRPALRGVAAWRGLSVAISRLWEWDWEGAAVEAKRCLLVARDEQTRDEALNIIACAHWQLGDDTEAIAALTHALEGAYTEGLQVNVGVIAATFEPQLAGEHLGRLAMQAPTIALRVAAAERALGVWYSDPEPWDDQENERSLPTQLREALRALVQEEIGETAFARFARTLSRWDQDWLADPTSLADSPHGRSPAAIVYQAKARDFDEFVRELAQVIGQECPPEWATRERDSLVDAAISALDPNDANPAAASFGLALIDNGLPMDAGTTIDLIAFTLMAVCAAIDPSEAEPRERFIDMLQLARERLGNVKAEERERSTELLDFTARRVIGSFAAARANEYDQVVDVYNRIMFQVRGVPSYRLNRSALRDATEPAMAFLNDTIRILERLIDISPDPDIKGSLKEFREEAQRLRQMFKSLRGG